MDLSPSEVTSPFKNNEADQSKYLKTELITSVEPQLVESGTSKCLADNNRRFLKRRFSVMERKVLADRRYLERKKMEMERLKNEIRRYEEELSQLRTNRSLLALDLDKVECCFSQATSQWHDDQTEEVSKSSSIQKHQRIQDQQKISSNDGGVAISQNLTNNKERTPNARAAVNEPATEHQESAQSGSCSAEVAKIKLPKFLMELHTEVASNVDLSDFTGLEGEQRRFGRFSFPLSLIPTVERINSVYSDISATSLVSPSVSATVYVLFCAVIREMEHLRLEEVTEDILLKWRDVIKDALRLGFNVAFAMEHLKKVVCAYFGQPGCKLLHEIDSKISTLEAEVNDWKKKRAEIYEEFKMSIDAVENFIGVPVSTGLFPWSSSNRIMHG
ncbi:Laminin subunit beta-1 [Gossypium arboreum]|uniref:Laminin subunit beta-1 n=1 Tax=Gossypium arboreum TaxID=29729 RepID=A0A0B0NSI0_GOSAR|nr:Laminin subunit beta-1 [Gossypium arboreum]